jgi:Bacterial membrane protein YfhO
VAVLETDPGLTQRQHGVAGHAYYHELEPEDVRIDVEAPDPSILVVRNAWDEGWSATLDGRPVPLLRVDGFVQGVAVPQGSHGVRLVYREPAIGRGIALSALALLGLMAVVAVAFVRGRRGQASGASAGGDGSDEAPTGSTGA